MSPSRLPVLAYHAIHPDRSLISITPGEFEWQLVTLKENGFQVVTLNQLVQWIKHGIEFPYRAVVLTFDDGLECIYHFALPILKKFDFVAMVFLVSGFIDKDNSWPGQPEIIDKLPTLSWGQIREMDRSGIQFGAHTLTHPRLDLLTPVEIEREILDCKESIQDQLGHAVDQFAYPYGRYNDQVLNLVKKNFIGACSTRLDYATPRSDPYLIERIDINYISHPALFKRLTSSAVSFYLSARRPLRRFHATLTRQPWQ